MKTDQIELKRIAGEKVVEFIRSGMIVGLGSGSSAYFALKKLGELITSGSLSDIKGIPTSTETEANAINFGIPLTDLSENQSIDITFDGADEVDKNLDLIKGGGGALLREKIIAQASKRNIIVIDESKISSKLGENWPVPIEVIPMAEKVEKKFLESIGAKTRIRKKDEGVNYITNEGNIIIDADFGIIGSNKELEEKLTVRAGIVETGLFIDLATDLICATRRGVEYIEKSNIDQYQNLLNVKKSI